VVFLEIKKNKYILYITYSIVLAFILFNYKDVINIMLSILSLATPLYIGIVIAFILNIPMRKIENILSKRIKRKGVLRGASVALTLACALIVILLFGSFIIPRIFASITLIFENLFKYITSLVIMINNVLSKLHIKNTLSIVSIETTIMNNFDINNLIQKSTQLVSQTGVNIIFQSIGFFGIILNCITSFMMGIYLLINKENYIVQLRKLITYIFGYKRALTMFDIGAEANHYFNEFVSGQLLECLIFMTFMYIVLRLFSLPFPELIACLVAMFSLVPMFGTFVGFIVTFILVLAAQPESALLFAVCFICVQQIEGNIVYPRIVGEAVGISGLYVLLALVVFSNLFGFVGLLIAVPSMALIYAVGSRVINIGLYRKRIEVTLKNIKRIEDMDDDIPSKYRGH
jgi:predicted PurR-regulated permease PerM